MALGTPKFRDRKIIFRKKKGRENIRISREAKELERSIRPETDINPVLGKYISEQKNDGEKKSKENEITEFDIAAAAADGVKKYFDDLASSKEALANDSENEYHELANQKLETMRQESIHLISIYKNSLRQLPKDKKRDFIDEMDDLAKRIKDIEIVKGKGSLEAKMDGMQKGIMAIKKINEAMEKYLEKK